SEDHVGRFFRDHDRRAVRIGTGHSRHYRRINDPQALHTADAQLWVTHALRIPTHRAGAYWMLRYPRVGADIGVECGGRGDRRPGHDLAPGQVSLRLGTVDAAHDLDTAPRRFEIVTFGEDIQRDR